MAKVVPPQLGAESFSCPHCGALAHQYWYRVIIRQFDKDKRPSEMGLDILNRVNLAKIEDEKDRRRTEAFLARLKGNLVTYMIREHDVYSSAEMVNMAMSSCHSCDGFAVWVKGGIVYPLRNVEIECHADMPDPIREDFEEAAAIVNRSARGAAALLRLAIQKLMPLLGEKGNNINEDIASLVQKGLDADIQQAMDILRVIGNNAVHPGQIDLKDDKATALKLFDLLNLVVERRIATPNKIKALFGELPEGAREAIAKRDAPKET